MLIVRETLLRRRSFLIKRSTSGHSLTLFAVGSESTIQFGTNGCRSPKMNLMSSGPVLITSGRNQVTLALQILHSLDHHPMLRFCTLHLVQRLLLLVPPLCHLRNVSLKSTRKINPHSPNCWMSICVNLGIICLSVQPTGCTHPTGWKWLTSWIPIALNGLMRRSRNSQLHRLSCTKF